MTLQELRYIVAVAEEASFTRAAERVYVSQPALSSAVQKLEDELGVAVFERRRGVVVVTEIGARLVAQARRALAEAAEVKRIAQTGRDPLAGTLRLGVIHTIGPYLLPRLWRSLAELAPALTPLVEESTTASIEAALREDRLDAAILALPTEASGVEVHALYDEPFAVLVPANHPWAALETLAPASLASEARVLRLGEVHCFSHQVAEVCPELAGRSGAAQAGNSLETLRHMVRQGLGITVLPVSALAEAYRIPDTAVVPFTAPAPSRRVALIARRAYARPAVVACLEEAIRAAVDPACSLVDGQVGR
jgi:LysR family transcriptional regulator, hydrogen peroxide-inducible genes activator